MNPIMFHYFHDEGSACKADGSVSEKTLCRVIENKSIKILDVSVWLDKFSKNKLSTNETCITIDDALFEQGEIALPVLDSYNIESLINVTSYNFRANKGYECFETHRVFRRDYYIDNEDYYSHYFNVAKRYIDLDLDLERKFIENYLSGSVFYSFNDRLYRYLRDVAIPAYHDSILKLMMDEKKVNVCTVNDSLWMNVSNLRKASAKHMIGGHSNEHSTQMDSLSEQEQFDSYFQNKVLLESELGCAVQAVAYPCGKYNQFTEKVMKDLSIKYGFLATLDSHRFGTIDPMLSIPRIDSTDFIKKYISEN